MVDDGLTQAGDKCVAKTMEYLGLTVDAHVLTQKLVAEKISGHLPVAVFFCCLHAHKIDISILLALLPVIDKPQLNQLGMHWHDAAR